MITGLERDELIKIIGDYDGLAVRSSTKVTPPVMEAASNMKKSLGAQALAWIILI